jgi:hypothetical protein
VALGGAFTVTVALPDRELFGQAGFASWYAALTSAYVNVPALVVATGIVALALAAMFTVTFAPPFTL